MTDLYFGTLTPIPSPPTARFHMGTAVYSEVLVIYNPAALSIEASKTIDRLLWFEFSSENANIKTAANTLALDIGLYASNSSRCNRGP